MSSEEDRQAIIDGVEDNDEMFSVLKERYEAPKLPVVFCHGLFGALFLFLSLTSSLLTLFLSFPLSSLLPLPPPPSLFLPPRPSLLAPLHLNQVSTTSAPPP